MPHEGTLKQKENVQPRMFAVYSEFDWGWKGGGIATAKLWSVFPSLYMSVVHFCQGTSCQIPGVAERISHSPKPRSIPTLMCCSARFHDLSQSCLCGYGGRFMWCEFPAAGQCQTCLPSRCAVELHTYRTSDASTKLWSPCVSPRESICAGRADTAGISSCPEILNEFIEPSVSANAEFLSGEKQDLSRLEFAMIWNVTLKNLLYVLRAEPCLNCFFGDIYRPFSLHRWRLKLSNNDLLLFGWSSERRKNVEMCSHVSWKGESKCSTRIWRDCILICHEPFA